MVCSVTEAQANVGHLGVCPVVCENVKTGMRLDGLDVGGSIREYWLPRLVDVDGRLGDVEGASRDLYFLLLLRLPLRAWTTRQRKTPRVSISSKLRSHPRQLSPTAPLLAAIQISDGSVTSIDWIGPPQLQDTSACATARGGQDSAQRRQSHSGPASTMAIPSISQIYRELGVPALWASPRDVKLLLTTRFIRLFAYGATTLILALFLKAQDVTLKGIGLFMSLTLFGDVVVSLLLTLIADKIGRRRMLSFGALLIAFSGVVFAFTDSYWLLVLTSVVGVISPSGSEIGPFRAIEESTIASLVPADVRADLFAWYVISGTLSRALGNLACGWLVTALQNGGWTPLQSYKIIFLCYAMLGTTNAVISSFLSARCEEDHEARARKVEAEDIDDDDHTESQPFLMQDSPTADTYAHALPPPKSKPSIFEKITALLPHITRESRSILIKLCLLFGVDSFASGLMPASLITLYFHDTFAFPPGALGTLFFMTNLVSSVGNLLASAVARRIGLIKTMVFTHLPSAICLALIPAFASVYPAVALIVVRSLLGSMDQAPRSAFLAAVMKPKERTAVMGIVTVTKTLSQSAGPLVTGLVGGGGLLWVSFVISGGLKAGYDLSLLVMFTALHWVGRSKEERMNKSRDEESEHHDSESEA
ncbi:hypothetical protein Dda_2623 [Drechslerella dactyloides]|uniref:Major facilitator superfamily (MFS) profile domain-containing protein n=1 Tax=Drechslerella dactyloides TaxID=74499 RepID=A0AAD6IZU8_DREDA|nr:hypothetical protein Dda_2623 [Drechslerella dactyloides]